MKRSISKGVAAAVICLAFLICFAGGQPVQAYNYYYGTLHNHSTVSDGSGDPEEAYEYARDTGGLDFFGLSDHASQISQNEWEDGKSVAESFNQDGVYVTFWGFEWSSNDDWGHITVIQTDDYCDSRTDATDTFDELMTWLSNRDGLAFLNHPGREDTGHEFTHFDPNADFSKVAGMELFNKGSGFDVYYYNEGYFNNDGGLGYYDEALTHGWDIGASGGEDHHGTSWGTATDYRLVILADELTREALHYSLEARRFFSSEDKNMTLSFKANGQQMGSIITPGAVNFVIQAGDGDTEHFDEIQLIKNGQVVNAWTNLSNASPDISHSLFGADGDYFYVKVTQEDGDEAISSPIWMAGEPVPDFDPPTPDPMTWETLPHALGSQTVAMTATTASDVSGVEYYFDCVYGDCNDSGWQTGRDYTDTDLLPSTTYGYTVTARDRSSSGNMTVESLVAQVTTDEGIVGKGYQLSRNADFSTEDTEFSVADTLHVKIWNEWIDFNDMDKAEYEIKVDGERFKGKLTNHYDGTFTVSLDLSSASLGSGTVKLKIEDDQDVKYEVKDVPFTVVAYIDTEPPGAVSGLTVTAISSSRLALNWNANPEGDVSHYNVYRIDDGHNTLIASPSATAFTVTQLEAETTYHFCVTAVDESSNESNTCQEASGTTLEADITAPSQVTGLAVGTVSNSVLVLSWYANGESDLSHYQVYRSTTPDSGHVAIASTDTPAYTDTNLEPSTSYYYQVSAVDTSSNEGARSQEVWGTTDEGIVGKGYQLSRNADFSTEDTEFSVADTLHAIIWNEWIDFNDMDKAEYEIKVDGERFKGKLTNHRDGTFTVSLDLSSASLGSGTVKLKIEDDQDVKYEVKDVPFTVVAYIDTEPPGAVSGLTVTAISSSLLALNWNSSPEGDVSHYNVYRIDDGRYTLIASPSATAFTVTQLEAETTYHYCVTAVDESSYESNTCEVVSGTTLEVDTTAPSQVTGLAVGTVSNSALVLSWDAGDEPDLSHYQVYRSTTPGSGYVAIASTATPAYTDTDLEPSTPYYYQVSAVDTSANEGALSQEVSGTTEEGIVGKGYKLSKNADFSTEDTEFSVADTLHAKIWNEWIDFNDMHNAEYEIKVDGERFKGELTNHYNGTFTVSLDFSSASPGSGEVKLKIEDEINVKYEVKDVPINVTNGN